MKNTMRLGPVVVALVLGMTACGQPNGQSGQSADGIQSESGSQSSETVASSEIKNCLVIDSSDTTAALLNVETESALAAAKEDLGTSFATAEVKDGSAVVSQLSKFVDDDCSIIFGVGESLSSAFEDAASQNPSVKFALVNADFDSSPSNARALDFDTPQAAFLAGYVAAGMTGTGTVATFLGEATEQEIQMASGFAEGVAKYNEVNGTGVKVIGWDAEKKSGESTGSLSDVEKAKQLTSELQDQGADIVMPIAGASSVGALQAAKEKGQTFVIWTDSDGVESQKDYANIILTSVTKDVSEAVVATVNDVMDGNFDSTPYVGTLKNGGVSLAPWHEFEQLVSQDLKDQIEKIQKEIADVSIAIG